MDQMQTGQPTPSSGSNKKTIIIVIAVVAIIALGTLAKGFLGGSMAERAAERAIERAGGGDANVDFRGDNTATYKSDEGSVTVGENVSLPSNWPSDVSMVRDAKIYYAMSSNPSTGGAGIGAMFGTSQSVSEVLGYYKTELPKQGWTIEGELSMAGASVLSATKGDRSLSVTVATGDNETSVTIGVSE
ncbi:MAG: hypothetical protein NUV42_00880 [Candidatus Yonathbacteria bacterium]|nr:hypothetical protein [Candidatus Yonathbacteria bacterium]